MTSQHTYDDPTQRSGLILPNDRTTTDDQSPPALPAWLWWSGLALMLAALMAPILVVTVPPLSDYPDHLARCYFLAFGASDPVMSRIFAARWQLVPNLAIDLIVPALMHALPPLVAGRVFVALVVVLPATGIVALSLAVFRVRSLWQLGAGFVVYDMMFLSGSLNFQFAAGVALWGAAVWVVLSARHLVWAAAAGAVFALLAFLCHLFGYGFFAVLIGSVELTAIRRRGLGDAAGRRIAAGRSLAVAAALLPCVVLYVTSAFARAGGAVMWQSVRHKLFLLLVPVLGYGRLESFFVAAVLAGAMLWWAVHRQLRVAPFGWLAGALLLAAYAILPVGAKGGYWIDTRMPVLLGFLVFAVTLPVRLPRRQAMLASVVLAGVFAGRMAYITAVWAGSRQDVADVRAVLTHVEPGSRILVMDADPQQHRWEAGDIPASRVAAHGMATAYWHYGAFALLDRRAFWSNAFAEPGQQPIVILPPYDASSDGGFAPPHDVALLEANATAASNRDPAALLAGWPGRFEYVLVLGADPGPQIDGLLPGRLALLTHKGIAALFMVRH